VDMERLAKQRDIYTELLFSFC